MQSGLKLKEGDFFLDRGAKAVLHSHNKYPVLATLLYPGSEFRISRLEMIKGLYNPVLGRAFRYDEELVVPIIENTCFEKDLKDEMRKAMRLYPQSNAVLVRRHGIYVWGDSWQQCKTQAESYHYLMEMAVDMARMGLNEHAQLATAATAAAKEAKPAPTPSPSKPSVAAPPPPTISKAAPQQQSPRKNVPVVKPAEAAATNSSSPAAAATPQRSSGGAAKKAVAAAAAKKSPTKAAAKQTAAAAAASSNNGTPGGVSGGKVTKKTRRGFRGGAVRNGGTPRGGPATRGGR